jgi:hypothetical protein
MTLDDLHRLAVEIAPELGPVLRLATLAEGGPDLGCSAFAAPAVGLIVFAEAPTADLLVHEVAHLLPLRCAASVMRLASTVTADKVVSLVAAEGPVLPAAVEEHFHDAAFARMGLHLAYRAERAGVPIDLRAAHLSGWDYGSTPAWVLANLLGDEPERLVGATFGEIEATPAPAAFLERFEADRAFYRNLRLPRGERGDLLRT